MKVQEKTILVFWVFLAVMNGIYAIAGSYSGPVWGFCFAVFAGIHWWKRRSSLFIMVVSIIWILFHVYEWIALGPGRYPIFLYINMIIPALLFYFGIKSYLLSKSQSGDEKEGEGQ